MNPAVGLFASGAIKKIGSALGGNIASNMRNGQLSSKSLSQYTQALQIRPHIAIESILVNDVNAPLLVQTAMSNYAAYYTLALSVDCTINGVSLGKTLDKYSPNRNPKDAIISVLGDAAVKVSTESYDSSPTITGKRLSDSLPPHQFPDLPDAYVKAQEKKEQAGIEEQQAIIQVFAEEGSNVEIELEHDDSKLELSKEDWFSRVDSFDDKDGNRVHRKVPGKADAALDSIVKGVSTDNTPTTVSSSTLVKEINDASNLAVGKLLEVDISRNGQNATIKMLLKPTIINLQSRTVAACFTLGSKPRTSSERKTAYQLGLIGSIWDVLTAKDYWQAHRKNLVNDSTGYYEKTAKRVFNNSVAGLVTGNFSVGSVANTFIVSTGTITQVEVATGTRFTNQRQRDKIMAEAGVMTLIAYDADHQRVFIYNHGIEDVTNISLNYLARKSKEEKFDYDIFKMLSQGSAPIL